MERQGFAAILALIACAALAEVGCDGTPEPVAPRESAAAVAQGGGVVHSAVGSGSFSGYGPKPFGWRVFAFNAAERADGSVKGKFELGVTKLLNTSGDILCISVVGNEAWVGGVIRRITLPELDYVVGWVGVFRVVDNGEGQAAPVDQITYFDAFPDPDVASAYCQDRPVWQELNDIEAGNIQVIRHD